MKLIILLLLPLTAFSKDYTFVGFQLGSSTINSDIESEENKDNGQMYGVYLGKEYKFKNKFNLNVGMEYNNHKVDTILDTDRYSEVELESNYFTISLNPTYSFNKLDLGLKLDQAISNDGILVTQEDSAKSLLGLNAYYNVDMKEDKFRVGLFVQKALDQNYTHVGASVQYGFGKVKKAYKRKKEHVTYITFRDDVVNFENDSAKLSLKSKAFLAELGTYLNEHSYNWKHLEITGHTSTDGKLEYNKYLSYKRTNSVFTIFKEMGVSSKKVTLEGKGELSPLVVEKTKADKRKNRRVELKIIGMKKDKEFKRFVEILKKKHK